MTAPLPKYRMVSTAALKKMRREDLVRLLETTPN